MLVVAVLHNGAPTAHAADDAKLVLVLDSSGSMKEKVGGDRKIDIAKSALNTVVGKLPAGAQVGLRVYGATVFNRSDRGACTDSQLVVPIGTGNRAALKSEIAKYKPYGETPISYSLKQAAMDLGTTGKRTIVLVSDGEETCHVDPCVTAEMLAKKGIDLKIDVIGLRVSGKARSQLRCVADRGNGTYYDADNRQQIEESLDTLATRAFRPFRFTGTPVKGASTAAKAPTVVPGQYVDTFPAGKETELHYRIPRTIPGSTLRAGLTTIARNGDIANVSLELSGLSGAYCGEGGDGEIAGVGSLPLVSAEVDSWNDPPAKACYNDKALLLEVRGSYVSKHTFELVVTEEPPVVTTRLPPAVGTMRWESMKGAGPTHKAPAPGSSISDAPVLQPGTYTSTILTGETAVFAVNADWGQRVQAEAVIKPRHGALARALGVASSLNIKLIGPLRGAYKFQQVSGKPVSDSNLGDPAETYRVSETTPTVRYLNRRSTVNAPASVPGLQYVEVNMSTDFNSRPYLVPYTLTVKVVGVAGTGKPTYVAPATPSPSPTPTPTQSPSVPVSASPSASAAPANPPSTGVGVGTVVGIALGAVALGAAGTAAALWARRRRRPGSQP